MVNSFSFKAVRRPEIDPAATVLGTRAGRKVVEKGVAPRSARRLCRRPGRESPIPKSPRESKRGFETSNRGIIAHGIVRGNAICPGTDYRGGR